MEDLPSWHIRHSGGFQKLRGRNWTLCPIWLVYRIGNCCRFAKADIELETATVAVLPARGKTSDHLKLKSRAAMDRLLGFAKMAKADRKSVTVTDLASCERPGAKSVCKIGKLISRG
jgi:hypothetical protein